MKLSVAVVAVVALSLACMGALTAGKLVTFDNTAPRLDSAGAILRAHDGTTQRFGGKGPYFCP